MTFLRSVLLLKLCSKECLGFAGEIMKFENMNNHMRRKIKERELAVGVTLQTEDLLQSSIRGVKIRAEKGAIGELNNNLGKHSCLLK